MLLFNSYPVFDDGVLTKIQTGNIHDINAT